MSTVYTVLHKSSRLFDSTKVVGCVANTLWCMNPACTLIVLRWSGVCVCVCMSVHVHISSLSWWAVNDEFLTHTHTYMQAQLRKCCCPTGEKTERDL